MTTINRAFIKVYRQDAAEVVPSGPIIAHARATSIAALNQSVEFVATTDVGMRRIADGTSQGGALVSTSIDVLPPSAAIPVVVPGRSAAGPGESRSVRRRYQPAPRRVDRPIAAKKPLSAYIGPHRSVLAARSPTETHEFRPGTTVASFRWPAVCRQLSHERASELDSVVDRVLFAATERPPVVGTLGLFAGSGCTTTALCLASRLAGRRCRAILVDGNFSSPGLARCLDVVPTLGWQEALVNGSPIEDAIVRAVDDQLDLLAQSAARPGDLLELIAGPETSQSAQLLRQEYELVLVDLGAFFDPASQPLALELVRQMGIDTVIAVAGPNAADPRDLATVAEYLQASGCELLGIVENRSAKPQAA
jgi:Mrp family chromosome partitioning ATPase